MFSGRTSGDGNGLPPRPKLLPWLLLLAADSSPLEASDADSPEEAEPAELDSLPLSLSLPLPLLASLSLLLLLLLLLLALSESDAVDDASLSLLSAPALPLDCSLGLRRCARRRLRWPRRDRDRD